MIQAVGVQHMRDVPSECLFRLGPDVHPDPRGPAVNTLAFLLFMARYDIDVRTGAARLQMTRRAEKES